MRRNGDEVGLLPIVIGQFEEADTARLGPGIDNLGLDDCRHFLSSAEPLPSCKPGANNIRATARVRIRLLCREKGNETGIVASFDSNLLAERAANGLQR